MQADASLSLHSMASCAGALALVLGLLWIAYRIANAARASGSTFRIGLLSAARGNQTSHLNVRQSLSLDGKRRIHVLDCEQDRFLILTGGPQDTIIGPLRRVQP